MRRIMNRWAVYTLVLCVLAGGLVGCGEEEAAGPAEDLGPNLLIEASGQVSLKREGWSNYVPVSFGTQVRRGDLVQPEAGRAATILCADLTLHSLQHKGGCPCKVREPVLMYGPARLLSPRGGGEDIPYILGPRNTTVLDPRPLLRWHDTGASSYTVAVYRADKAIWQQTGVTTPEIRYPDDAPALQPGVDYLLAVVDLDTGHSSGEDKAKGLGFRVLSAEERAAVEARRDEILGLSLGEPSRRFALAVYYTGQELRAEALAILDALEPGSDAPSVDLWRGDLLAAMQLPDDARAAYEAALAAAQDAVDREAEAEAQAGLWRVTGDAARCEAAVSVYEALGDQAQADALREEGCP